VLVQDKLKPTVIYGIVFGIVGTFCAMAGTVLGIIGLYDMYDLNRTLADVTSGKLPTPPGTLVAGLTLFGISLAVISAAIAMGIYALGLLKKEGLEEVH
jgi:hypothetical protein